VGGRARRADAAARCPEYGCTTPVWLLCTSGSAVRVRCRRLSASIAFLRRWRKRALPPLLRQACLVGDRADPGYHIFCSAFPARLLSAALMRVFIQRLSSPLFGVAGAAFVCRVRFTSVPGCRAALGSPRLAHNQQEPDRDPWFLPASVSNHSGRGGIPQRAAHFSRCSAF